jgi:glutathione S-transferase
MKLYDAMAPNPRRVRIFMAEKGIELPIEHLELMEGQSRKPEFMAKNSLGETPVLELDDGRYLTESIAICRYLEHLYPEPALFGKTAEDKAFVEMWTRRMEQLIMGPFGAYGIHSFEFFADKIEQVPAYAETQMRLIPKRWSWLDAEISDGRPFIAGDAFSVADITGAATLMIASFISYEVPTDLKHVRAWADRIQTRPSVSSQIVST